MSYRPGRSGCPAAPGTTLRHDQHWLRPPQPLHPTQPRSGAAGLAVLSGRLPVRIWPTDIEYAASVSITSGETMGWLRAAVGVALIAAPAVPIRLSGREEPTAAGLLLMRTVGVRDLVLGLGTVAAARSSDAPDGRRWTAAALASDSLDAAISIASFRTIGKRDSVGAAVLALAFVCGDLRARCQDPAGP
jgi:hypothetical protein